MSKKPVSIALGFLFALLLSASARADSADSGLVKIKSPHDVPTTIDRLKAAVEENDITVMARVDHAANASKVGMDLRPTELLIFGKPELGTLLMQADQTIGLDLPMKVLAWEDADGQVWLAYVAPEELARRHGVDPDHEAVGKMAAGLQKLTEAATSER